MTTDQTTTWHPKVGQLARYHNDTETCAVLAVGDTTACVSYAHDHDEPCSIRGHIGLVRVCPWGHDWGGDPDGDVCETCHPTLVQGVEDPVPVVWANFYDDGDPSVHYTEAAARRHADADPVDAIEVAVPLYREARP